MPGTSNIKSMSDPMSIPMSFPATQLTDQTLSKAVSELCAREPRFLGVVEKHGLPSLRPMPQGLEGLLLTVTEQFLSLAAAAKIWQRIAARLDPLTSETILACPHAELMALGLSGAKAKSFHGIARAISDNAFVPTHLPHLNDEDARKRLLALPGVGPWTADIYLLAALQRPNVWPWGDLALQAAAQNLFRLRVRPDRTRMLKLGRTFEPWRAVAARLLWSHYRGLKGMKQA